jgi:polysaccharide export outer membrane protein
MRKIFFFLTFFLWIALAVRPVTLHAEEVPTEVYSAATINSGDKIKIDVYREPDLSGVFSVNALGSMTYPLLGDIYVQGLTTPELRDFLTQSLGSDYLVNPQVEVEYAESPNNAVGILGQVVKPGNYILPANRSFLKAIATAGGFTAEAFTADVRIVRTDRAGKKSTLRINVEKILNGEEQDIDLVQGDIVFVDVVKAPVAPGGAGQAGGEKGEEFVTVLGQIQKPGNYYVNAEITLIRLIGQAGGFTAVAATNRVRVVRSNPKGGQKVFYVNAGAVMAGRAEDVPLEKGDLVVVSETFF